MYKCIVDFIIDRAGEQFIFASGTIWNAKENEYGSITISNEPYFSKAFTTRH